MLVAEVLYRSPRSCIRGVSSATLERKRINTTRISISIRSFRSKPMTTTGEALLRSGLVQLMHADHSIDSWTGTSRSRGPGRRMIKPIRLFIPRPTRGLLTVMSEGYSSSSPGVSLPLVTRTRRVRPRQSRSRSTENTSLRVVSSLYLSMTATFNDCRSRHHPAKLPRGVSL